VKTRNLVLLAFAALAFCGYAVVATAQQPDCALSRRAYDGYLGDGKVGGFTAPRYVHQTIHVGLAVSVTELAHLVLHTRPVASAVIGAVAIGIVPHARDAFVRPIYGVTTRDALADAMLASIPLVAAVGWSARGWQSKVLAATTIIGGYLAAACWASP